MIQRALLVFCLASVAAGCRGRREAPTATGPATEPLPRVASLVPAATDLILGMGASDHLVAVSNYDGVEIGSRELPRVGDYASTDWEALAFVRPSVMIIQMDPARLPAGFTPKADRLGIRLVNVRLNTLSELLHTIPDLGRAVGEPEKGDELARRLSARLDALRKKSANRPRVKALLTLDEEGATLVGDGTFLDDLLAAAGGDNAAAPLRAAWPAADAETLMQLAPDAVILLKPEAKGDVLARTKARWARLSGVPAARTGRIFLIADGGVLLPGAHVADLAEKMERCLYPEKEPPE